MNQIDMLNGYLKTNNYKVVNGFEELERNQKGQYFQTLSPFNRIAKPYYEKHEFKDNIKFFGIKKLTPRNLKKIINPYGSLSRKRIPLWMTTRRRHAA